MDYNNKQPDSFNPNYKLFNVLSYIGILFIVGLIAAPNDPRCKHHLNNGIILALIWLVVSVASSVLGVIIGIIAIIPVIGWIIAATGGIVIFAMWLLPFIAAIKGIIDAVNDKEEPLLFIGKYLGNIKIIK